MAISIDFTMFDTTDPKLTKSADSLESALAQLSKNTASFANTNALITSTPTSAVPSSGSGFDEWLANDFQLSALPADDATSLSSSPFSALDDSPILGLDSFTAAMGPSLFDMGLGLSDLVSDLSGTAAAVTTAASPLLPMSASTLPQPKPIATPAPASMLTTAAVQHAAAALNIPWSRDLEIAVMAQAQAQAQVHSVRASVAAAMNVLPALNTTPAMIIPKLEPSEYEAIKSTTKKRAQSPDDEPDEVVAKRAKNTDAARRSRLKKLVRLETLESKVTELESTNNRLTMKVAILETEKNSHLVKDAEQSIRIAQLEAKLAEAHALLTSRA